MEFLKHRVCSELMGFFSKPYVLIVFGCLRHIHIWSYTVHIYITPCIYFTIFTTLIHTHKVCIVSVLALFLQSFRCLKLLHFSKSLRFQWSCLPSCAEWCPFGACVPSCTATQREKPRRMVQCASGFSTLRRGTRTCGHLATNTGNIVKTHGWIGNAWDLYTYPCWNSDCSKICQKGRVNIVNGQSQGTVRVKIDGLPIPKGGLVENPHTPICGRFQK